MDLFYLKDTNLKIANKVKKTTSCFSSFLTTNIQTKSQNSLTNFKFIQNEPTDLRYFDEPLTMCELNESLRLLQIKENLATLKKRQKSVENSQGQIDEILSRISEQREKLNKLKKDSLKSQSAFDSSSQEILQSIESSKTRLQSNKTLQKFAEIEIESKSLSNQKLQTETLDLQSQVSTLISTIDSHTNNLHKIQSAMLSKAAKLSSYSNTISSLVSQSHSLHCQLQADFDIKLKLEQEIEKFYN